MAAMVVYDKATNVIVCVTQQCGIPVSEFDVGRYSIPADQAYLVIEDADLPADIARYRADAGGLYRMVEVAADKPTIAADGVDTATVTAQVSDQQWAGDVLFEVAGQTYVVPASGGVATFSVSSTSAGKIVVTVTANPPTGRQWGSDSIVIAAQ